MVNGLFEKARMTFYFACFTWKLSTFTERF